jgi:hypothetical protein
MIIYGGIEQMWNSCITEMKKGSFLSRLRIINNNDVTDKMIYDINKYTMHKNFNPDEVVKSSKGAAILCEWVLYM